MVKPLPSRGLLACGLVCLLGGTALAAPAYYQSTPSIAALQAYGIQSPLIAHAIVNDEQGAGSEFDWIIGSLPCNSVTGGGDKGTTFCASNGQGGFNTSGYWKRLYSGLPNLAFWGLSAFASGSAGYTANTTALNNAVASGLTGYFQANANSTFKFNGPIVWTNNTCPVGGGSDSTKFVNQTATDAFRFINTSGDFNTRHCSPAHFQINQTTGSGNYLFAQWFGNQDTFEDIYAVDPTNTSKGGTAFELEGDFNLHTIDIRGDLVGGDCIHLTASGAHSQSTGSHAVLMDNPQCTHNQGNGFLLDGSAIGLVVNGGDMTSNGITGGTYNGYNITSGGGIHINLTYEEGCVNGKVCNHFGGSSLLTDVTATFVWGDSSTSGGSRVFADINGSAANNVSVGPISYNTGGGFDTGDKLVTITTCASSCSAIAGTASNGVIQPYLDFTNSDASSRIVEPPYAEAGVKATADGAHTQTLTNSTFTGVNYSTTVNDPLGQWLPSCAGSPLVCNTFIPGDFGSFAVSTTLLINHNDGAAASNQVNIGFYDVTASVFACPFTVFKGVIDGSSLTFNCTTNLTSTHSYQVQVEYVPGTGSPTVTVNNSAQLTGLQISRTH